MYQYHLYLVKSDYAKHFYYKIDTVYRFLQEQMMDQPSKSAQGQYKLVLDKVYAKDLFLHLNYWKDQDIHINMNRNHINLMDCKQSISLTVNDYSISISAETIVDLDQILFRSIKTFHPHVFVVNYETYECGWITPFVGKQIYSL
ncbi:sporulation inhibitor of replication protein SirA [Piscibacillus salipiscarius]|uniref:Sporulation inhibitor of replication protein SirA n=1 Tax=Piscibacillus salipiscarius TaxID=299480 RepID=A0ABW5Q998_9BACI|nr:sporulation inhibitor of replication protein SirA [Piscibacillus salipiscarius]